MQIKQVAVVGADPARAEQGFGGVVCRDDAAGAADEKHAQRRCVEKALKSGLVDSRRALAALVRREIHERGQHHPSPAGAEGGQVDLDGEFRCVSA